MTMDATFLTLVARAIGPLLTCLGAYWLYNTFRVYVPPKHEDSLLMGIYIASRVGLLLAFAIFFQQYVTSSDPKLFYTAELDHFLAGEIPIRDFYYPYAPLMMPAMLPFYLLLGRTLAGISLFAIFAEALALFFFLKCTRMLEMTGEMSRSWVRDALALYLFNPATLYWTVFQGYHSIVQTAYAMAGLYFLLRGYRKTGYAIGMFGLAGAKLIAVLDWPAFLAVRPPRLSALLVGAVPLVLTYAVYQMITGDILFPVRYHLGYIGEGNVWYLTTLFGDFNKFYSAPPGSLLPLPFFALPSLAGFFLWMKNERTGLATFSFHTAMGVTTFTMSLFFIVSLYAASYYAPMLMLPASVIVTSPAIRRRYGVWSLLLISGLGIAGDAIYAAFRLPGALFTVISTGSATQQYLAGFWAFTILIRIACFLLLAQLGWRAAISKPSIWAACHPRVSIGGSSSA
jgi:hypothetical protein